MFSYFCAKKNQSIRFRAVLRSQELASKENMLRTGFLLANFPVKRKKKKKEKSFWEE